MMEESHGPAAAFSVSGVVEKFEDKNAVIILADGQRIFWPIKNLPDDTQAGSPVRLLLSTAKTQQAELEKLAKTVLNRILKTADPNFEVEHGKH